MSAPPRSAVTVNLTPTTIGTPNRETAAPAPVRMSIAKVNFYYGTKQTLFDVNMTVAANRVTALIGPSGCGKSTLLRTFNRMHETVRNARLEGEILLDGQNILSQDVTLLRRRVGMVFQRPNPFPKSIFDNVAYGPRINGAKESIAEIVDDWNETSCGLSELPQRWTPAMSAPATNMSGFLASACDARSPP